MNCTKCDYPYSQCDCYADTLDTRHLRYNGLGPNNAAGKILTSLLVHPMEAGMTHPSEEDLSKYIKRYGDVGAETLIQKTLWKAPNVSPSVRMYADLIKLLSHCPFVSMDFRRRTVHRGLTSDDLEVRDAAITAAENWEGTDLADILAAHDEKEGWLREYMERVIVNLRAT